VRYSVDYAVPWVLPPRLLSVKPARFGIRNRELITVGITVGITIAIATASSQDTPIRCPHFIRLDLLS